MMLWIASYSPDARAAVYKCRDEAGAITYSQTPCPLQDKTVRVTGGGDPSPPAECWYANQLAVATARDMRNGVPSDEIFDRYGGLNALSNGTISLVNYVYTHRANEAVSAERIAGLAEARCKARALGDVSCEALPRGFTQRFGGCGHARPEGPAPIQPQTPHFSVQRPRPAVSDPPPASDERDSEQQRTEQCIATHQKQLQRIDSQMRAGYNSRQGEIYRQRQRDLKKRLNEC